MIKIENERAYLIISKRKCVIIQIFYIILRQELDKMAW